ncbi:MAG: N-acetylmuramoyl-L-alanine amidase [Prevotellaceae bacterium]|nr:N-acetylmuramoyl-L-alanine amidase [Prevotellaceae bacterium]
MTLNTCFLDIYAQKKDFVVVLDAGHGAHDGGAVGSFAKEKNLNLAVTLALGEMIEQNFDDVKVVYTRKKDVFIPLQGRADIANSNNADLFISIHTNSNTSSKPFGAETYTLGLAKTKANLDVARRENAVILLESDYKTKYKGFDNSVDSYIMFELMQNKFIDQSIELASEVQKQFGKSERYNRGVRQAGFWVLHATAAPAVLVEMGFISNRAEEKFLASKNGQKKIATSIYNAFATYKHNFDKRSGKATAKNPKLIDIQNDTTQIDTSKEEISTADLDKTDPNNQTSKPKTAIKSKQETMQPNASNVDLPVFKVQILASRKKLVKNDAAFRGLENVDFYEEGNWYKYTVGSTSSYAEIQKIQVQATKKHPEAFIIAFLNEKKISVIDAVKISKNTKK